jgi:DNA-binding response OmpR family regulator
VLVVGATEREVHPWLRAAGHATRVAPGVDAALAALGEEPADLVIADREPDGLDVSGVCLALREDPRLGSAWLLAVTAPVRGGISDVGADDYLHRPFTRVQLLARARTGLRAVHQRADDALLRSLMATVPGAIYR